MLETQHVFAVEINMSESINPYVPEENPLNTLRGKKHGACSENDALVIDSCPRWKDCVFHWVSFILLGWEQVKAVEDEADASRQGWINNAKTTKPKKKGMLGNAQMFKQFPLGNVSFLILLLLLPSFGSCTWAHQSHRKLESVFKPSDILRVLSLMIFLDKKKLIYNIETCFHYSFHALLSAQWNLLCVKLLKVCCRLSKADFYF